MAIETNLSKLTIVIVSYKRSTDLFNVMNYWSDKEPNVLVYDGSPEAIENKKINKLGKNIRYFHIPTISFEDRIKESFEQISTEYVTMHADDEILLPSGLSASIAKLEEDKSLVSCMGRCMGLYIENEKVFARLAYPEMENYSILDDNPVHRIVRHLNPYTSSAIYAVSRREIWINSVKTYIKAHGKAYAVAELQFELSVCFYGKSAVIPQLHWLRNYKNKPIRETEADDTYHESKVIKPFSKWWLDNKKRAEKRILISSMVEHLNSDRKIANWYLRKSLYFAFDEFVKGQKEWPVFSKFRKFLHNASLWFHKIIGIYHPEQGNDIGFHSFSTLDPDEFDKFVKKLKSIGIMHDDKEVSEAISSLKFL